jgi:hypothetical protein
VAAMPCITLPGCERGLGRRPVAAQTSPPRCVPVLADAGGGSAKGKRKDAAEEAPPPPPKYPPSWTGPAPGGAASSLATLSALLGARRGGAGKRAVSTKTSPGLYPKPG